MKKITLSFSELQQATEYAAALKQQKEYCKDWDVEKLAMGIRGEIAYGKFIDEKINTTIYETTGDGGADFRDGTDVKTISWTGPEPQLKLNRIPYKTKKQKLVLAIFDKNNPTDINLIGEISFENFKARCKEKTYGTMKWFAVTDKELDVLY